jgi:formylglycine-generating enzyme required for sulfatase activity
MNKDLKTIGNVAVVAALLLFTVCKTLAQSHPAEPEMVEVEGGTFLMGCTEEQPRGQCHSQETPVHEVTLSRFSIGKYEVTQAQWEALMGSNPSYFKGSSLPVEMVCWDEAQEFIERLNAATGKQYRLPTEAEWEYAARGGKKSRTYKYSGSNSIRDVAWMSTNSAITTNPVGTRIVGTKMANELGIYDMSGNVQEWCYDWNSDYSASAQNNPVGDSSGSRRVCRGGGWRHDASGCRVAFRAFYKPGHSGNNIGFRLACSLEKDERFGMQVQPAKPRSVEPEMVFVQGGTFTMGCTEEEGRASGCDDEAKPAHSVTVSSFQIGNYEVTQAQWKAIMGNNPNSYKGDNLPVTGVSWNYIQEFISRLNAATGKNYGLPTEAEWEYAARGGNRSKGYKYSGSDNLDEVAWYASLEIHPVGTKKANELGIHDMSGNAEEWCQDRYGDYSALPQQNPVGASKGPRIARGGSWTDKSFYCRVSSRNHNTPGRYIPSVGFRLVLTTRQAQDKEENTDKTQHPVEPEMVQVEGGSFAMGCTSEQGSDCTDILEKPAHSVTVSSFQIGKYEVTQAQWKAIMGTGVRQKRDKINSNRELYGEGDNYPMYYVSWDDAQEFISRLNARTGKNYRLPTEAEWEYAARGGNRSQGYKYSGSDNPDEVSWHEDNADELTHPVGMKKANELGIHDMSGNIWEWCQDRRGMYTAAPQQNPTIASASTDYFRVNRGGGFMYAAVVGRVTCRRGDSPNSFASGLGFRVVLADEKTSSQAVQNCYNTYRHRGIEAYNARKYEKARDYFTDALNACSSSEIPANNDVGNWIKKCNEAIGGEHKMVFVEGGTFTMGCKSEYSYDCRDNEVPAHSVTVGSFQIGKYEVTQVQWTAIMENNPSESRGDNRPVEHVNWDEVQEFISRLNKATGKNYRLPTEAEWEYAARGGNRSQGYEYSGSNDLDEVAWYFGNSDGKTHPAGTKKANELGIHDMNGNVYEWCQDRYRYNYYPDAPQDSDNVFVMRGGDRYDNPISCGVASRNSCDRKYCRHDCGFRLVLDVKE